MYHLVKGIYTSLTRKEGLDNAGKTTLLEKLKSEYSESKRGLDPDKIMPTVGQNVGHITINGTLLRLWDVGGSENLRSLWDSYYSDAHAVVFVVDSTDRERLEECRDTLEKVVGSEATQGIPILMLANKQDREDSMGVVDIKEIFNKIAEKMGARDSRVLPVSALTGAGVADSVDWLVTRLLRNKQDRPPNYR
ncbi:uncharacterized protein SAPINGB_P006000 [Magnusiomyces paraingens]|uniref:ADP-ribosylation factor-like protein 3 n=1 Tax=Magnusiomyces paraingens TaxID=2606893 RepID=A0A5E8C9W8_9ASCO|nr:uncharacterized protein SAPINGB_P006000 [Saprochaete ingens]VVT58026.1 unnamed protein product [Saprochaete ingens]